MTDRKQTDPHPYDLYIAFRGQGDHPQFMRTELIAAEHLAAAAGVEKASIASLRVARL